MSKKPDSTSLAKINASFSQQFVSPTKQSPKPGMPLSSPVWPSAEASSHSQPVVKFAIDAKTSQSQPIKMRPITTLSSASKGKSIIQSQGVVTAQKVLKSNIEKAEERQNLKYRVENALSEKDEFVRSQKLTAIFSDPRVDRESLFEVWRKTSSQHYSYAPKEKVPSSASKVVQKNSYTDLVKSTRSEPATPLSSLKLFASKSAPSSIQKLQTSTQPHKRSLNANANPALINYPQSEASTPYPKRQKITVSPSKSTQTVKFGNPSPQTNIIRDKSALKPR